MQVFLIKNPHAIEPVSFTLDLPSVPRIGESVDFKLFGEYIIGEVVNIKYTNRRAPNQIIVEVK